MDETEPKLLCHANAQAPPSVAVWHVSAALDSRIPSAALGFFGCFGY
ncbi:MAG: hypothetical protein Q7T22_09485 [Serpentinimonas sp.]|nr:hypothetical protein [Serpentinimonas sp.]MDO9610343.1 hypothetical protein [Serpentinimonas sp.]